MSQPNRLLIVVGSGPGIAAATAAAFAKKTAVSHIALISRTAERLEQDAANLLSVAPAVSVKHWAVDVADAPAYGAVLDQVLSWSQSEAARLQAVLFNAARVRESVLLETPLDEVEYEFRITNSALLTTIRWAVPPMLKLANTKGEVAPTFLVTNSVLYKTPSPQHFALSLTKAAQRTLVISLKDAYERQGIHFALLSIGGPVDPEGPKNLRPSSIAARALKLYEQGKYPIYEWDWDVEILEKDH